MAFAGSFRLLHLGGHRFGESLGETLGGYSGALDRYPPAGCTSCNFVGNCLEDRGEYEGSARWAEMLVRWDFSWACGSWRRI